LAARAEGPESESPTIVRTAATTTIAAPTKPVPISLDVVLRLAQDQNARIGLARERVEEAFAEKDVAARRWLPDLYVGPSYYRHEGGIQNPDGTFVHSSFGSFFGGVEINGQLDFRDAVFQRVNAERKVWQQRGELSRITSETLLDAAGTYIDFLSAYETEAILRGTDKDLQDLLKKATDLADTEKALRVEVVRVQAEVANRQQLILSAREKAAGAQAKLAYLLGLNPDATLVPVDHRLVALSLVDAARPVSELVAQALATGPGVQEMEGLLAHIQSAIAQAQGFTKYLPVVGVRLGEWAYGAGPGARSDWDNRLDMGLQARWNLTEFVTARDRQRVAQARLSQARLTYQDLRGKLTAGVQEARETIQSGRQQLQLAEEQIKLSRETFKLAQDRLKDLTAERRAPPSEVLLSIRAVMAAQLNYLVILRDYDKAQLRLMVLLGHVSSSADGSCHGP
jgi:outer membrane protein TolC